MCIRIVNNAKRRNQSSLDLSHKELTTLPPEIGQLTKLKKLNLTGNRLTSLPAEVGLLTELEEMNLSHNEITNFPDEFWRLPKLNTLRLASNRLKKVPTNISQLSNLALLDLGNNEIERLDAEIEQLWRLGVLILERNALRALELNNMPNLLYVDVGHNKLSELPSSIFSSTKLRALYARGNRLTSISPEIKNLTSLETVSFQGNQLSSIPVEIGYLNRLTRLDLSDNRLTELPASLGELRSLSTAADADTAPIIEGLHVDGNPLPPPYPNLIGEGQPMATHNVLAWLRGDLDPSKLDASDSIDIEEISEAELEGALEQRPASFRFGVRNGKIDTLPEQPTAADIDVAIDLHSELLSKTRTLEKRLAQTNSDARALTSVNRLLSELERDIGQMRPGILLSRSRSIEADRNAFDSEEGRRELFPDAIAMMDDVLLSLQDLMAIFPVVREIEAERLALAIQSDLKTLDSITTNTSVIKEVASGSEIVTQAATDAIRENDEQISGARTLTVQSRLIADQLLIIRNFVGGAALFARNALAPGVKRVTSELGELGGKSWEEVKTNLPVGIGTASRALPMVALIGLLAAISPPVAGIAGAAAALRPLSRALKKIIGSANAAESSKNRSATKHNPKTA